MTCIVMHRDGWSVADSRGTQGPHTIPSVYKKVLRLGTPTHTLIGIAGQASVIHDFQTLVAEAGEDLKMAPEIFRLAMQELSERSKDGGVGEAILVNKNREIYLLDSLGAATLLTPETEFYIIGSGEDTAYGYLHRCKELNASITIEDAKGAILAAATRNFTVGGPLITETLYN